MEQIVFDNKTLSDVFKDIYTNSENKRGEIQQFIIKLVKMIHSADEAEILAPIIKEFYEVAVKNDEHLVRVAQIAQRAMNIGSKFSEESQILTESEKQQLIQNFQSDVDTLQKDAQEVEDTLENLRA